MLASRQVQWRLVSRSVAKASVIILTVILGMELAVGLAVVGGAGDFGTDYRFYRDSAARWLSGGGFYLPHQLAGPYQVVSGVDVLYPPPALLWFAPFTVLPAAAWWAIPLTVLGYAFWRWRPGYWTLAVTLLLLLPFRAVGAFLWGNTDLWGAAAVAGGLVWGWPAALLALKPSVLPLAVVGLWSRSLWVGLAGVVLASLVFWPMWDDYVTAIRNADLGADYSVGALSLYLIPILAWAAHRSASWRSARLASWQPGLG